MTPPNSPVTASSTLPKLVPSPPAHAASWWCPTNDGIHCAVTNRCIEGDSCGVPHAHQAEGGQMVMPDGFYARGTSPVRLLTV